VLTLHEEIAGELAMGDDRLDISAAEGEAMGMLPGEYQRVGVRVVSEHRWYAKQLIAFRRNDGELLGFYYLKPASEIQEGQDRFEADPVPTFAVASREVTTTVYEEVK
jgi:hypothetical protein